jgi:hypothetical protein
MDKQPMEDIQKDQEFLRTTQAALEIEAKEMAQVSNRLHDNLVRAMRLMWRQLFFIWAMVIVLLIAYFFILRKTSPIGQVAAPRLPAASEGVVVSPQIPPAQRTVESVPIPEWDEIRGILEQVREAQLKKDIGLFLEVYAPTFPNLNQKKASILKTWEKYDYLDMHFTIESIQKPNANTIIAKVVWDITLEDLHSRKKSVLIKDYTVQFSQIAGKWLIQELILGDQTSAVAVKVG